MSDFKKCSECGEYHFVNQDCEPAWKVFYEPWLGDDFKIVRALDEEDAAIRFGAYYNERADYALMNETIEVFVENGDGEKVKYKVSAEPSINYSASTI